MLKPNIETFLACESSFEEARLVLYGAPFDSTTSFRPGARFASRAIRQESYGLESYSPYQNLDLLDCPIFDSGDLELNFGNSEAALASIEERAAIILEQKKLPFMIGGEHLVTLGAVRAAVKHYPDLHILHLDAHADLREDYLGVALSHACVLRRCHELTGDGRIHQFGIRSGDREEFLWGKKHVNMTPFTLNGLADTVKRLGRTPVYFTLDLDILDPSVFPGTGTPEPGGVSFEALREAVTLIGKELRVIGADVNELSPHYDQSGASTAVACKIIRELLLALSNHA